MTPASNPAWNPWISGTFTPPMKPTLLLLVSSAAAAPTRYEPSLAAKINAVTLGASSIQPVDLGRVRFACTCFEFTDDG